MTRQTHEREETKPQPDYYTFRLRRRSFTEWCGWLIWLIMLGILVEYAITSLSEDEPQAGILAGVIALGLLLAGIIVEFMKSVDLRSEYDTQPPQEERDDKSAG